MPFQLPLNKTFSPTPPPLIHRQLKHHQKTKTNKAILSASPSSVFHKVHNIGIEKQVSIPSYWQLNLDCHFRSPLLDLKVLCLTDSEHKFHKTGIKNWLPIGFNLAFVATTLCLTTNRESLKFLYAHP